MDKKVTIVTGGTYGIGRGIAMRLAKDGYKVIALGNNDKYHQQSKLLFNSNGLDIDVHLCDVSIVSDVQKTVKETLDRYSRIDVLCNVAAIRPVGNILETDQNTWEQTFDVNVKGVYLFCKEVLPHMISMQKGIIINFGSTSGNGGTSHIAYCTTKGAITALTKCLALDHVKDHIRVNAVIPGSTLSGMNENRPESITKKIAENNVAGRINEPDDIANAVAFLVSDQAATISGAFLDIGTVQGKMAIIERWN